MSALRWEVRRRSRRLRSARARTSGRPRRLELFPGRVVHTTTRGEHTYDASDVTLEVRSGNAFVLTPKGQLRKSFCVFTDEDGQHVRAAFTAAGVEVVEPASENTPTA